MQDTLYRVSYGLLHNPGDQADAVQECIRRALEKREALRDPRFMGTWMVRILINVCHDMLRKRKREFPSGEIPIAITPTSNFLMVDAFSRLEERFRLPLILHHIEGYTTKEIARMLHIPEGTVKNRLIKARKLFKIIIEEGGPGYDAI